MRGLEMIAQPLHIPERKLCIQCQAEAVIRVAK